MKGILFLKISILLNVIGVIILLLEASFAGLGYVISSIIFIFSFICCIKAYLLFKKTDLLQDFKIWLIGSIMLCCIFILISAPPILMDPINARYTWQCKANLNQIKLAVGRFRDQRGRFPEHIQELYPDYIRNTKIFFCPAWKKGRGDISKQILSIEGIYSNYEIIKTEQGLIIQDDLPKHSVFGIKTRMSVKIYITD
jgi:hypothetical protein